MGRQGLHLPSDGGSLGRGHTSPSHRGPMRNFPLCLEVTKGRASCLLWPPLGPTQRAGLPLLSVCENGNDRVTRVPFGSFPGQRALCQHWGDRHSHGLVNGESLGWGSNHGYSLVVQGSLRSQLSWFHPQTGLLSPKGVTLPSKRTLPQAETFPPSD